jgi:hypothetical protein
MWFSTVTGVKVYAIFCSFSSLLNNINDTHLKGANEFFSGRQKNEQICFHVTFNETILYSW